MACALSPQPPLHQLPGRPGRARHTSSAGRGWRRVGPMGGAPREARRGRGRGHASSGAGGGSRGVNARRREVDAGANGKDCGRRVGRVSIHGGIRGAGPRGKGGVREE